MFEVGQKVWDVVRGEGVVVSVDNHPDYPVVVTLDSGVTESYTADGKYISDHANPSIYPHPVEVIKKVSKPSINWGHVRKDFKFLAQDANGDVWLYCEKPELNEDGWHVTQGECSTVYSYASYTSGTCNWEDSLVTRPKGV